MRNKLILLTLFILTFSCSVKEKPEFLRIENIKVIDSNLESITLSTNAFFNNPNDIGGTLKSDGIIVLVNDIEIGKISSDDFKVPANKEFSIPLQITVSTTDIINKDTNGVVGGIINSLLSKKVKVQYKGFITYKALGISYDYPVDKTENVKIKL
jgi:hypothetical protein